MKFSSPLSGKSPIGIFLWTATFFVFVILVLTHDIIITNILANHICKANQNPNTFIKKTVDFPDSIYWEDNIYPGFDEQDRLLMIRNYLDGVHLKTMALNSPGGRIYVYNATEQDWLGSRSIQKKTPADWKKYFNLLDREAKKIAERGQTYTRGTMPRLNYRVVFNPIALTSFERRYLWADEVTIADAKTGVVIGYNRRLMHRWYMIFPDISVGNRFYNPKAMCGDSGYFLPGIVFEYSKEFHKQIKMHKISVETILYKKSTKEGGE